MRTQNSFPDALPVLTAGRHRNPRDGGCVMEYVSLLAGERWSDHPSCTHPLLAHLARTVNDRTSDESRGALARLVPGLAGAHSSDRSWSLEIATVVALHTLRAVRGHETRILAVALLTLDRLLAPTDGRPPAERRPATSEALATVPEAAAWAEQFTQEMGNPRHVRGLTRGIVDMALAAVARQPGADETLVAMLSDAVATCQALAAREAAAADRVGQDVPPKAGDGAVRRPRGRLRHHLHADEVRRSAATLR